MTGAHLIPRIGERIERLDTALFSGPASCWRYPSCIIRKLRMDKSGKSLWFPMSNISMHDDPAIATPGFLFCYNKRYDFYITVEGKATIIGHAGELTSPEGWVDPILRAQRIYLIRFDVERSASHFRHGTTAAGVGPASSQKGKTSGIGRRLSVLPGILNVCLDDTKLGKLLS